MAIAFENVNMTSEKNTDLHMFDNISNFYLAY